MSATYLLLHHKSRSWCKQEDMGTIIMQRRWRWIGYIIRKDNESITKIALYWTPKVRGKGSRPKNTWRRTVEAELRGLKLEQNWRWNKIQQLAKDRQKCKNFAAALRASGHNELRMRNWHLFPFRVNLFSFNLVKTS